MNLVDAIRLEAQALRDAVECGRASSTMTADDIVELLLRIAERAESDA